MPIIFFLFCLRPQGDTESNVLLDYSITSLWQGLYGSHCSYSAMQEFGTCGLINVPGPRHIRAGFWLRWNWWLGCWAAPALLPACLQADARLPLRSGAWSHTAAARNSTACLFFSQELKHMAWLCRDFFLSSPARNCPFLPDRSGEASVWPSLLIAGAAKFSIVARSGTPKVPLGSHHSSLCMAPFPPVLT